MSSSQITLKDGRQATLEIITAPTPQEYQKILQLLNHKPGPYLNHFNDFHGSGSDGVIEGLEWRFHLARTGADYVANICTWERDGLGILGHVYTRPEWRGLGLAGAMLHFQDEDFRARGGRIMELNTGYQSMPYRLYQKHGYVDVAGAPGSMVKTSQPDVWPDLYREAATHLTPFQWRHWPSANLLFLTEHPAYVRSAGIGAYGITHLEGAIVHCREHLWSKEPEPSWKAMVLETAKGAVTAWASLQWDLNWSHEPRRLVFDLFFHPTCQAAMESALKNLAIPKGTISYSTPADPKNPLLEQSGFRSLGKISGFFPNGEDLVVWAR